MAEDSSSLQSSSGWVQSDKGAIARSASYRPEPPIIAFDVACCIFSWNKSSGSRTSATTRGFKRQIIYHALPFNDSQGMRGRFRELFGACWKMIGKFPGEDANQVESRDERPHAVSSLIQREKSS